MPITTIPEFNADETRREAFIPWVDEKNADVAQNAFFKRGFYYTRNDRDGAYAGFAELRAFNARIPAFSVDAFVVVVSGEITITDGSGSFTLKQGDTVTVPRHLDSHWRQTEGTRIFFMVYAGPAPAPADVSSIKAIRPDTAATLESVDGPAAELILSSPLPEVGRKVIYQDPSGNFSVGIWAATPYTRKLAAFKDYEVMHLVEGAVAITNALGETRVFKSGDTFIVNSGVANAWKSEIDLRKVYAKIKPAS